MVAVTSKAWVLAATVFGGLLLAFFVWALQRTDIFRVAPMLPAWADARAMESRLRRNLQGKWPLGSNSVKSNLPAVDDANALAIKEVLVRRYETFDWPVDAVARATMVDEYREAAATALDEGMPGDDKPEEVKKAVIGLALFGRRWQTHRIPYSLARVQSGVWLMFAVSAAVYLWLVYGEFPALAGSVLGLVAISVATSGGSHMVDKAGGRLPKPSPSKGLLFDLITDDDDVQQVHRYQALVVNILLLIVGLMFVVTRLVYPSFDATWLGLLGISGIAQTVGKQVLEKDKP